MTLSAGIIIARREREQWVYLLLRAFNYWDFPKGEVEQDEDPLETAVRELREETGLVRISFPWGEVFRETEAYRGGRKKARYYLAETEESRVRFSVNPEIGRPEHQEYRWLRGADLKALASARLHPVIDWARGIIEEKI